MATRDAAVRATLETSSYVAGMRRMAAELRYAVARKLLLVAQEAMRVVDEQAARQRRAQQGPAVKPAAWGPKRGDA